MPYQDLYNQMATAAPAPNPYAQALRTQPMAIPRPPRPQQQTQQGGGNNMASIASKIAKKYFGGDPTTTSGAGGGLSTAPAVGTATGGGITTLGGANMGLGGGISGASVTGGAAGAGLGGGVAGGATTGISGASVTGGSAGAGLGGGSAAGGAAAGGAGAAAMGAGVLAMPFIAKELWGDGNSNIAAALRNFKTGQDEKGPRGLSLTEEGGVTFIKGDEGEVDRAWRQAMDHGIRGHLIRPGVLSLEAKSDDVKPFLASNSPGMDNSLFGYLSNG